MAVSKVILVIGILYSWVMAIKMIILSMLAILAHNCMFENVMKSEPLAYLLHLLYFRSKHCEKEINWSYLGLSDKNLPFADAVLPQQSLAVTRTFAFAIMYMSFNILLSLAAVASLLSVRKHQDRTVFKTSFSGVVIFTIAVLFLDFVAMTFYILDCFKAKSPAGLMELLNVLNPNEVRPMFEAIPFEQRIMPSIIMVFATSKGIFLLVINVIFMSIVISTSWISRKEKAKTQNFSQQRTTISDNNVNENAHSETGINNSAFSPD